jgi:hypothetical protein
VPLGDVDSRQYPDATIYCKVDGIEIDNAVVTGDVLRKGEGWHHEFDEYRISETAIQKLRFSKPVSIMVLEMSVKIAAKLSLCLSTRRFSLNTILQA